MAKTNKVSKFFKTLLTVLMVLIILLTIVINIAFSKSTSAPSIMGHSIFVVNSNDVIYYTQKDSTGNVIVGEDGQPVQYEIKSGDVVISDANKVGELAVGNIALCLTSYDEEFKQVLRVMDITQENGVTYYTVKADNSESSFRLTQDKIVAKCTDSYSGLGNYINFVKSVVGIIILIGVPCLVLFIMGISNTIAQRKEEEREEEERQKAKKKATNNAKAKQQKSHTESVPAKKPEISTNSTKKDRNNIAVKTLSEEDSIKQREEISNMIGSELNTNRNSVEKTITFDNSTVTVSKSTNLNAIKINEDESTPKNERDDVHSPNMNEKANKIRQALANNVFDDEPKPTKTEPKETVSTPIIAEEPVATPEPKNEEDTTNSTETDNQDVIVFNEPTQSTTNDTIIPDDTAIDYTETSMKSSTEEVSKINDLEDDFFEDFVTSNNDDKKSTEHVSNDFLDEILNSIPSANPTPKEPVRKETSNTVPKRKPVRHHSTQPVKTVKHRVTTKLSDNTSFDELIKAIEKEKSNIK